MKLKKTPEVMSKMEIINNKEYEKMEQSVSES